MNLAQLTEEIKNIAVNRYISGYHIDLSNHAIDKSNENYKKLTNLSKLIMYEQCQLFEDKSFDTSGKRCRSCLIREKNKIIS